jgi:carbonic anhydrase
MQLRSGATVADVKGADARVPETTIMGCSPGEIFCVRNIAKSVHPLLGSIYRRKLTTSTYSPHDDSTNGVLAIALQNFKVKHVVITGHSNCVGCQQALNVSRLPSVPATTSLQRYLKPIAALASTLSTEDGPCTLDKLVEVSL